MLCASATRSLMLPSEVVVKKKELFKHVQQMKDERVFAMGLHREAAGRSGWNFEYDDKCGSYFLHLPNVGNGVAAMAMGAGSIALAFKPTYSSVH